MTIDEETQEFLNGLENLSWEQLQEVLMDVNLAVAQKQNKIVFKIVFSGRDNVQ
jgi:hypothetical protein